MPFDLSTAKVIDEDKTQSFDLSTAKPIESSASSTFDLSTAKPIEPNQSFGLGLAANLDSSSPGNLEAFGYGFEKGSADIDYLARMGQAFRPMQVNPYVDNNSLSEKQLQANKDAEILRTLPTYQERLDYLNKVKEQRVESKYSNLTQEQKESGYATLGDIAKTITSPTTFISAPAALATKGDKLIKAGTKFGLYTGLWGGEYSALRQLSDEGEIDPKELAKDTAMSTGLGAGLRIAAPVVLKGVSAATNKTTKLFNDVVKKEKINLSADEFINELNLEAATIIRNNGGRDYLNVSGVIDTNNVVNKDKLKEVILFDLAKKSGRTVDEIKTIEKSSKNVFKVPENELDAAEIVAKNQYDLYTNPDKNPYKYKPLQMISSGLVKGQRFIDKHIRPTYEVLKEISPKLAEKLLRFDYNVLTKNANLNKEAMPFFKAYNKLDSAEKKIAKTALLDGDYKTVENIIGNDVGLYNVRNILERLRVEQNKSGIKVDKLINYFPRYVTNHQQYLDRVNNFLKESGSSREYSEITNVIKKLGTEATQEEKANAVNKYMQKQTVQGKSRVLKNIDERLVDEYLDPVESLERYLLSATNKIEKANFFGKYARIKQGNGNQNIMDSIGALPEVQELGSRADAVRNILEARMVFGEQGSGLARIPKNISYITLLANPSSALMQFSDAAFSSIQNGLVLTGKNMLKQFTRQKFGNKLKYSIDDIGIDKPSVEIGNTKGAWDKATEKLFDYSQFSRVDRVGKTTTINSAYEKAQNLVKLNKDFKLNDPKGYAKFKSSWQGTLGEDGFTQMVADLRMGKKSEDVGFYLFSELSKVQPISLSQMPEQYLRMKGGRILYTLKSFALKQFDFARKKILTEFSRGEYKTALKNSIVLSANIGTATTVTEQLQKLAVLSPEEIRPEDMPDEFIENLLNVLYVNKYDTKRLADTGNIVEFAINKISPPVQIGADISMDIYDLMGQPAKDKTFSELMSEATEQTIPFKRTRKYAPLFGRNLNEQQKREKRLKDLLKQISSPEEF